MYKSIGTQEEASKPLPEAQCSQLSTAYRTIS